VNISQPKLRSEKFDDNNNNNNNNNARFDLQYENSLLRSIAVKDLLVFISSTPQRQPVKRIPLSQEVLAKT
jgi:hypothetical protein